MMIWRNWRDQLCGRPPGAREAARRRRVAAAASQPVRTAESLPPILDQPTIPDDALWHIGGPCALCAAQRSSRGPITVSTTVSLGPSGPIALVGARSTR
jgi:hypothetical protein